MTMSMEKSPNLNENNRKASKPLMEKRRRARINQSLDHLQKLIFSESQKIPIKLNQVRNGRNTKLEKADILEMTVEYVRKLTKQETSDARETSSFEAGYGECLREVLLYIEHLDVEPSLRSRLLKHLSSRVVANDANIESDESTPASPSPPQSNSSSPVMGASAMDEDNSNGSSTASVSSLECYRRSNDDCIPMNLATSHRSLNSELSRFLSMDKSKIHRVIAARTPDGGNARNLKEHGGDQRAYDERIDAQRISAEPTDEHMASDEFVWRPW